MILNNYIGLPYKDNGRTRDGIDCWGLARLYYLEQLNIELPSYETDYVGETSENIKQLILQHKENWQEQKEPIIGDLVLFNIFGEPTHIGIYIGDNKFLHVREGMDSVIENLDNFKWNKRLAGFFRYQEQTELMPVVSAPHPLQTMVIREWTVAGTTVTDYVNFVKEKYKVSERLVERIVITIDGIPIHKDNWDATVLQRGQVVTYRAVPGKDAARLIATLVVAYVAFYVVGPMAFEFAGGTLAGGVPVMEGATWYAKAAMMAATAVTQIAGMALINAIMPIRPPDMNQNNPGSAQGMNLLSGASNQANRFGAIPVVLGKMRVTGLLGAAPYVETLTDTNLMTTMIIWGFGPLDIQDICVGTNPISTYYDNDVAQVNPHEVTLFGYDNDNPTEFNKLYGRDVQQQFPQKTLSNNTTVNATGATIGPWTTVTMDSPCERLDVTFSFPEGMRQVVVKGDKAGDINDISCGVEIQIAKYQANANNLQWDNLPTFKTATVTGGIGAETFVDPINPCNFVYHAGSYDADSTAIPCYQYITYAISPNDGSIKKFVGDITDQGNPDTGILSARSANLQTTMNNNSWAGTINGTSSVGIEPVVPAGYRTIWKVTNYANSGIIKTIDLRGSSANYTGLQLTTIQDVTTTWTGGDSSSSTSQWLVNITPGSISAANSAPATGTVTNIWSTAEMAGINGVTDPLKIHNNWGGVLSGKDSSNRYYAVWAGASATTFDKSTTVNFPYSGYYNITAGGDNSVKVQIAGSTAINMDKDAYHGDCTQVFYVDAGPQLVRITGRNTGGTITNTDQYGLAVPTNDNPAAVAVTITYEADGALNTVAQNSTQLWFGGAGMFQKRKDAFNFTHRLTMPVKDRYVIRCRRINDDTAEPTDTVHNYFSVSLFSVTGFTNTLPQIDPKGAPLAKTAVRIQSSGKVNGNIDGINALVTTIAWDYDYTKNDWVRRQTNNPASLFVYVLMHNANAYRVSDIAQLDAPTLVEWHNYCRVNGYTFNSVITNTQSVMSVLRDIAAAGKASPTFVNGKWSVVVDKARTNVVQYFTPHNSWGFESSKILPKIPDCFRVMIRDETRAYQENELRVYNYGYGENHGYKINAGSFAINRTYTITKRGTTNWNTVAGTTGEIYNEGDVFIAKTAGTGTGAAYTALNSGETVPAGATEVQAAQLFEELSLPGVTNAAQAINFARWHLAQLKLRPETYTLNADFEYLVCTRGDLVKVSHDVPLWGTGTGRIKSITTSTTDATKSIVVLDESIAMNSSKSYIMRVRTNYRTNDNTGIISTTKIISGITTNDYYDTFEVPLITVGDQIEVDNLCMIGEVNKETQDLVVLSIDTQSNTSAKITLTDYSPQMYTADLANDLLVYDTNITPRTAEIYKNTINYAPTIVSAISNYSLAEEISTGIYQNVLLISFATPTYSNTQVDPLMESATQIEIQIIRSNADFSDTSSVISGRIPKTQSSYTAHGLLTDTIYKIRARYTNDIGNISGPWSDILFVANNGNNTNTFSASTLYLDLDDVNLVATPTNITKPSDFDHWEFKIYKDTGSADFWDITPTLTDGISDIQTVTGYESGRFDLRNQHKPIISTSGVNYRVACRAVDRNGNYSDTSTINSILVKTIQ